MARPGKKNKEIAAMIRLRYLICLYLLFFFAVSTGELSAHSSIQPDNIQASADSLAFRVYFKAGEPYQRDTSFHDDRDLDSLARFCKQIVTDTAASVSFHLRGHASPEGSFEKNVSLARARQEYIAATIRIASKEKALIFTESRPGEDWMALRSALASCPYDWSDEAVSMIDSIDSPELLKACLKSIDGGRAWSWMSRTVFPQLRRVDVLAVVSREEAKQEEENEEASAPLPAPKAPKTVEVVETVSRTDTAVTAPAAPSDTAAIPSQSSIRKAADLAFSTNLLSDAALSPNIAVEFSMGRGWAACVSFTGAWWDVRSKNYFWRLYGLEAGARRYFNNDVDDFTTRLRGHHIGLYGQVFTYDMEFGGRGEMGGTPAMSIFNNPQYGAGVEYGYTFGIGKHLSLDLFLGVGYVGGLYHVYQPVRGEYVWQSTNRRHYIGPSRLGVSLVWHPWRKTMKGRNRTDTQ